MIKKIFQEGFQAFFNKLRIEGNPYPLYTDENESWSAGWLTHHRRDVLFYWRTEGEGGQAGTTYNRELITFLCLVEIKDRKLIHMPCIHQDSLDGGYWMPYSVKACGGHFKVIRWAYAPMRDPAKVDAMTPDEDWLVKSVWDWYVTQKKNVANKDNRPA